MTIPQAFAVAVEHHKAGRLPEAEALYRKILAVDPRHADALHLLGVLAHQMGRHAIAVDLIREAIALAPGVADFHSNLGIALYENGRVDDAIAAYRQAIALKPNFPEAQNNLGNALTDNRQLDEAIAAYRQAIALKPNYAEAHCNLGVALKDNGQLDDAIAAQRQAIALNTKFPEAYTNLGNALRDKGQLTEAVAACRQAVALNPSFAGAYNNLGFALKDNGQLEAAVAAFRQSIKLKPNDFEAHSNLLLTLNYDPGVNARSIDEERLRWSQQHAEPLRPSIQAHPNEPTPGRLLRVGYVSPDFRDHPVASFFEGLITAHDRTQIEVFCYANVARPDAVTARLRQAAAHWQSIIGMPDATVAEIIRQDHVDILVDLAGHTARHRLLVFARKPAPVQVTWLGYPGSTGMQTIDYRLTDALADPLGHAEHLQSETLVRLPRCAWCFRPTAAAPPVADPPVQHTGHVTFGCFNARPKINLPLLKSWAAILRAVPASRLLLKNSALLDSSARQDLQADIQNAGIDTERVELAGHSPTLGEHLATYGRVDIALDTFPYHGTTTTCEALWMGVPVVTLAGTTHVSRVGVSLLSNAGLPEMVATSPDQYVQLASALAADLPRLSQLRSTLRQRMAGSPLMDAPRFARDVEAAYREMWRQWCALQTG